MERIAFFVRAGQSRFSAGMNGAEDMVVLSKNLELVTGVIILLSDRLPCSRNRLRTTCSQTVGFAWASGSAVVGIFVLDHRLLPQLADQGDLLLLPLAAAAKMSGHLP